MNATHPHDEREGLSNLFDGEVDAQSDGDAARFALRRLDHDPSWKSSCERWQLMGDVLRGQKVAIAPTGFAERVAAMVAAEREHRPVSTVAVAVPATRRGRSRRQWVGGAALAASVAVAALFATRPSLDTSRDSAPAQGVGTAFAVQPAINRAPASVAVLPGNARPDAARQAPDLAPAVAAVAVVADLPRRIVERRSSRGQSQRASARPASLKPVLVASSAGSSMLASHSAAAPFALTAGEVISRPWPRASVAGVTASTLAASYGARGGEVSPFYPFEPRMPVAEPLPAPDAVPQP